MNVVHKLIVYSFTCQPAHILAAAAAELDADMRDCERAEIIRDELRHLQS